jgi:hypothetical protein
MPADGGLRQLHDIADLGDREFAALENREHAHANRIGQDSELIDDGGIHP